MNTYDSGDRIELKTNTSFQTTAGTPFDPDVVTFVVKDPAGVAVSYVYGVDAEVTTTTTGNYICTIDVETAGIWSYRVVGETSAGQNRGADELRFTVLPTLI